MPYAQYLLGECMLRDLSMILLIRENSHMLDEIIHYHAPTNIQLYVSHDCEEPYPIEEFRKYPNVKYIHTNNVTVYDRTASILPQITTEFCVFRADRRHQSNKVLRDALEFLQHNPEYSSGSGVWLNENLTIYHSLGIITDNGEEEDVVTRVENLGLSFQPPFYNVQRTNLIRAFYDMLPHIQKKIKNIYYLEYLHAFICYYTGKTKQLANFGGIVQDKKDFPTYINDWPKVGSLFVDEETTKYAATISRVALKKNGFPTKDIEKALEAYNNAMGLRFVLYRINGCNSGPEKVRTFGYLEKIFDMLNKKTPYDQRTVERYLRVLMSESFDFRCNLNHLMPTFAPNDIHDFEAITEMIKRIQAKQEDATT